MSRGLGKMQREILDTLEEAKQEMFRYHGSARLEPIYIEPGGRFKEGFWFTEKSEPGWVRSGGRVWQLPDDVYDLRASLKYLALRHSAVYAASYVESAFQASFSRAVKGLVCRGLLDTRGIVYLPRQRRFVRITDKARELSVMKKDITLSEGGAA